MRIIGFPIPPFYENTYVVAHDAQACIIDPGGDGGLIVEVLHGNRLTPQAILLTHAHIDHVSGVERLIEEYPDLPVHIHPGDLDLYTHISIQARMFAQPVPRLPKDPTLIHHEAKAACAGLLFEVIHTPGHSPGSVCFLLKDGESYILFTGDTLFYEGVGRTDLWKGDQEQLFRSIRERLYTLPDSTVCYPGHGQKTTIGHERFNNPFVQG